MKILSLARLISDSIVYDLLRRTTASRPKFALCHPCSLCEAAAMLVLVAGVLIVIRFTRFQVRSRLCLTAFLCCGCMDRETAPATMPGDTAVTQSGTKDAKAKSLDDPEFADVRHFCGNCHAVPGPQSFPKSMWYDEVRRGFNFYYESGRTDLSPPTQASVVACYRELAPEELPTADQSEAENSPIRFRVTDVSMPEGTLAGAAAVSFVDIRPGAETGSKDLWLSDMKSGTAAQLSDIGRYAVDTDSNAEGTVRFSYPKVARSPAAVRQVDLDGNGVDDLLVADLGSFLPEDHDRGKVVWIPDGVSAAPGNPVAILDRIGRVADVETGDFDGDGRIDVVAGEFGWHKTGGLWLLSNRPNADGTVSFEKTLLDDRPGTIHAIPTDLNQDGRLDIIAVISQEHEKVVAFINQADGFQKVSVYDAPDPAWGSSGVLLTDLDQDGDSDILYTNGDSFDSHVIKPYHGVWWLENKGSMPFVPHRLAAMPGVHRAIPSDLDLDGDLDIVIAAMLPDSTVQGLAADQLQAIVWLEHLATGEYLRHVIEHGPPRYAAMTVGDLNGDGRPDIVAGVFRGDESEASPVAKIYWNQKP